MDFKRAVSIAESNAEKLLPLASDFTLEGVIISNGTYEVTLSYYLTGKDPLSLTKDDTHKDSMFELARIMGRRREYKVFIIDAENFSFKGFKAYKEG